MKKKTFCLVIVVMLCSILASCMDFGPTPEEIYNEKFADLPEEFWDEAAKTVAEIGNRGYYSFLYEPETGSYLYKTDGNDIDKHGKPIKHFAVEEPDLIPELEAICETTGLDRFITTGVGETDYFYQTVFEVPGGNNRRYYLCCHIGEDVDYLDNPDYTDGFYRFAVAKNWYIAYVGLK